LDHGTRSDRSSCNVRPYTAGDRASLVCVINAVCAEGMMATRRFEPTPAWTHALAEPDCPCHLLLVAAGVEGVVGWCRAFRDPPGGIGVVSGDAASIGLGLLPGCRGLGYGKALLQRAIDWAAEQGLHHLWLATRPENERAVRLFLKLGFRPIGEWLGQEQVMIHTL